MRSAEVERLLKRDVLPHISNYAASKRLLYRVPVREVLGGFFCDATRSDKNELDVVTFVQVLLVPGETINFSASGWLCAPPPVIVRIDLNDPERGAKEIVRIVNANQRWVAEHTELDRVEKALRGRDANQDCYALQARAHIEAWNQDVDGAMKSIEQLLVHCEDRHEPWFDEVLSPTLELLNVLRTRPAHAPHLLQSWRQDSLESLRLQDATGA